MKEIFTIIDSIRIVFISADPTAQNIALDMGAVDYLLKPISIKSFLEMVKKYTL